MNRPVHFEIPADNPQAVMKFFTDVFGWKFQQFPGAEYWLATTGDEQSPGINGAVMKRNAPEQPIVNSIEVESMDVIFDKIVRLGGQIAVSKTVIPGTGWYGFFKDPDGNIHGLWEKNANAK